MQKSSFIPNLGLGQLLSVLLGYPLLLAFMATSLAETFGQNPWGWVTCFELAYLGALWGIYSHYKPRQPCTKTRLAKRSNAATAGH